MKNALRILALCLSLSTITWTSSAAAWGGDGYCMYFCTNDTTGEMQTLWPYGPMSQAECCSGVNGCPEGWSLFSVAWAPMYGNAELCY